MAEVKVWAPLAQRVRVQISEPDASDTWTTELTAAEGGWWRADVAEAIAGRDYGFLLDDSEDLLPDPRSRRQPHGVHRASRFYADDFEWSDGAWPGHELPGSVIYELHIGTFTAEGTFEAAARRLEHLAELGVTHLEVLPVNDFNGEWNWGYDGVLWYAVHEAYGGPDGFKRLVDRAHQLGLAVILDVVYNHLGPSGNYLPRYGPYFKPGRNTWGDLVNLDGDGSPAVREYILGNALMWLSEFHLDGLRLDAVHALQDSSEPHLLVELAERVSKLQDRAGRPLTLIAESDLNDPVMITPLAEHGYGMDAQWDDDVHHSLHALLTGERQGYYDDFGSLAGLAKVLTRAFFHDGTYSSFRKRPHGKPVDRSRTPGYRFVAFLQDHDQVGNRAIGDRLPEITSPALLRVGALLLLTSPFTPMLWMGEEWAASTRWPFFTSHPEPELAKATAEGRVAEFAEHGWDVSQMIDPQDPQAFRQAKLRWDELEQTEHAQMLDLYRRLLRLRREHPDLANPRLDEVRVDFDEQARWMVIHRGRLAVAVNLAEQAQTVLTPPGAILIATDDAAASGPDGVRLPAQSAAVLGTT
ncbi:MAG: malto-oligosyltrehalose trehalohydrolase [Frankiales bacterium]|nr:malto-oligosyltrehalose trehalohydrolase [Frankiales bacterium]